MTRFKNIFFLAVLLLAAWLIGQRLWTIHVERGARQAVAGENAAWATRLEPALDTIHGWSPKPEHRCDDAALAPRVSAAGEPWFAYAARAPDGSPIEAMSRPTPQAERFARAQLVVGLREHGGAAGQWSGTVVVLDLATGQALCWTEESGAPVLHERASAALERISRVAHVVD